MGSVPPSLPFLKRGVHLGTLIVVEQNGDWAHLGILLENRLNEMTERADHYFESPYQK
jgi:hypothetical protein